MHVDAVNAVTLYAYQLNTFAGNALIHRCECIFLCTLPLLFLSPLISITVILVLPCRGNGALPLWTLLNCDGAWVSCMAKGKRRGKGVLI